MKILKKPAAVIAAAAIVIGCMPQMKAVDFERLNGEFVRSDYEKSIITNNENTDLSVSDGATTRSRDFMTNSELEIYD